MRVLVITKRQYTNHDLLDDKFGRLREIPLALARRGHQVCGSCLSYEARAEGETRDPDGSGTGQVTWCTFNAGTLRFPGLLRYVRRVAAIAQHLAPDVILACSDSFYGIIGVWLAQKVGARCVFDLYDNFESFAATRIPGVLALYRRAVRRADGVTCVSSPLRQLIVNEYGRVKPTLVLTNAVQLDVFKPRDKIDCRRRLGLPEHAIIIGTAGALHTGRGIDALFQAYERLAASDNRIHLAIAGPRDRHTRVPKGRAIHDFGTLALEQVPLLLNSLDVAVICNKDSAFGRYCFPQKAYEILACRIPLVAARVGAMQELLADHPAILFTPEDAEDLARAIKTQLQARLVPDNPTPTWDQIGGELEDFLHQIIRQGSPGTDVHDR